MDSAYTATRKRRLGLRTPTSLAPLSFLSACASSERLASELSLGSPDPDEPRALELWRISAENETPSCWRSSC